MLSSPGALDIGPPGVRPLPRPAVRRAGRFSRRLRALAVSMLLFSLAGVSVCASPPAASASFAADSEQAVKAAFIYKFLGYVEWPDAPTGPLTIGVIGDDEIASSLERIAANRTVGDRPLRVVRIRSRNDLAGIRLLYIGEAAGISLRDLLTEAEQRSILTVTSAEEAFRAGSVINFRVIDDRVRFEISLEAAGKSRLKISSRLVPVAFYVRKATQ